MTFQLRPHILSPLCWCLPKEVMCECGEHSLTAHRFVEPLPDVQPRMSQYSVR